MTDALFAVQVQMHVDAVQRLEVLVAFTALLREHAAAADGFRGAQVLSSDCGSVVTAVLHWRDRDDWLRFGARPGVAAIVPPVLARRPDVLEHEVALVVPPAGVLQA